MAALQVWLLTLLSLVTVVLVLAWVAAMEARLYSTESRDTLGKAVLWSFSAFTQEGECSRSGDIQG